MLLPECGYIYGYGTFAGMVQLTPAGGPVQLFQNRFTTACYVLVSAGYVNYTAPLTSPQSARLNFMPSASVSSGGVTFDLTQTSPVLVLLPGQSLWCQIPVGPSTNLADVTVSTYYLKKDEK